MKFEHACFTLEQDGKCLVVDPGNITDDFVTPENVVGVVITHEHPDHLDTKKIEDILQKNPDAIIVTLASILAAHDWPNTHAVAARDVFEIGPFKLEFFGGKHALIHEKIPIAENVAMMVNDILYYPGDSFTLPERPVKVLAAPTSGPWLKLGEAVDFMLTVKPERAFSTHDAHSSEKNKQLIDSMLPKLIASANIEYMRLSKPLEIDG